ncbi:4-deoxy-4-formamido-L-arabinose-phosphoundecaprenol deformylase [Pectinatus sottacetonis]|uniref:4-deoxy-4-formamido-L-arabinose- phosphoundecaprenol deformylase n=1 Tax=Pectinatus sottacetonis TaxID=1002795 RepID=UPI0018C725B8|nr:4-deoxy-4-formamido-L-arabinose-phosphoundecaprenol deformylase [Pectinatus sottacetonis]
MSKKIAIKIDVDTKRGYEQGVPNMLNIFQKYNIHASFFFSMGPDNSGKAIRRIFRKGFLSKMLRTKAPATYGLKTMLYGTLLPAPYIVEPNPAPLLRALEDGHDCGIHCWDHVYWQDKLPHLSEDKIRQHLTMACSLFEKTAHQKPHFCGAPGWQVTPASLKVQQEFGFDFCSDVRGYYPFYPVMNGQDFSPIQIPGTLLTMDEVLGIMGVTDENIVDYWLKNCDKLWNVFTIHAEMEGLSKLSILEEFIVKAKQQNFEFVLLKEGKKVPNIKKCRVYTGTLPGRAGTVARQSDPIN